MTPAQEAELTGGGDCFSHWHSEDRRPTQDLLHGLQSLTYTKDINSSATLTGGEDIIRVDTSAGNITLTLPVATNGKEITVVKLSALNKLTISGQVGETINGRASIPYTTEWTSRTFKAIDGQWSIIGSFIRDKFPHGAFSSTQTQTTSAINTPTRVTFDQVDYTRGISYVTGDGIHVQQAGLYNIQFSCQLTNADTQTFDAQLWLRKGLNSGTAVDIPYTSSTVSVTGTHGGHLGHHIIAANFFQYLAVGEYIEFWWATNSVSIKLETLPPTTVLPVNPGSPSMVATLTYVSSETS